MIPPPFRYHRPETVAEAVRLRSEIEGSVYLAGGQSLVNALKLDLVQPASLIDIHRLNELRQIEESDGGLKIGAAVTYSELATSPVIQATIPMLSKVSGGLVDRQVRNRGTIGGNVCLNDPTNNLPPLLAALGATFEVLTRDGSTSFAADEFFLGTMHTAAHAGLLTEVSVPATALTTRVSYRHQQVGADSWALARVVGSVDLDGAGGLGNIRLYLAAVPGSPLRLTEVESALTGHSVIEEETARAALAAFDASDLEFVGDAHGTAPYRRRLARVQLARVIDDIRRQERAA